jgi:hypothetical protein
MSKLPTYAAINKFNPNDSPVTSYIINIFASNKIKNHLTIMTCRPCVTQLISLQIRDAF